MGQEPGQYLDANEAAAIDRLKALLAIPSISTDQAYAKAVAQAAQWVAERLRECGLSTQVVPTDGHPVVLGTSNDDPAADPTPTVLFYGHYDVQPPDPLEKWTSPPFEPTVRDGHLFARGACDDKGQICCFLEALRAWRQTRGRLPLPVKVLIEGEEECGSPHLEPFIAAHQGDLSADIVLASDTSMWEAPPGPSGPRRSPANPRRYTPAITYALRGLLYYDLKLHGPDRDLHSGIYGGTLANPATVLTEVLGQLFDKDHRVAIAGFYDDVIQPGESEARQWSELGFDERQFLGDVGGLPPFGEAGYSTLERRWARPACDVNGLYGGYGSAGAKTVIPSFAGAKLSFRLAADQSPEKIAAAFEAWIRSHDVHGCRWELTRLGEADPVSVPIDSPWIAAAGRVIQSCAGVPAALVREGATLPVVASFKKMLGLDSLLIGFGLDSDRVHCPDEHFGLDRFKLGCKTHAALLAELASVRCANKD